MPDPLVRDDQTTLHLGDCREVLVGLPAYSVDAIVCDPPYELGFMGKSWDSTGVAFQPATWAACLRVLKPGGHLLAFGGTRTYHRIAVAVEDAGFEIRDTVAWMYGSGFPKSLDVSKAIDKAAGAEREVVGNRSESSGRTVGEGTSAGYHGGIVSGHVADITVPATEDAAHWDGWGTALKPAFEPIVVARKPLIGTVAANVLAHGTGALNIDGCRVPFVSDSSESETKGKNRHADFGTGVRANHVLGRHNIARADQGNYDAPGRWPANVILDEQAGAMLDEQTGLSTSRIGQPRAARPGDGWGMSATGAEYNDEGGASRFFYCAKTSRRERNAGLDGFEGKARYKAGGVGGTGGWRDVNQAVTAPPDRNNHPTVKPIALMRYLVRLVTPPGGLVLDPFLGSGTTGIAAALEGFRFIGIEQDPDYLRIAQARIAYWAEHGENALDYRPATTNSTTADTEPTQLTWIP